MSTTSLVSTPLKYLDKAVNGLRDLGLMPEKPDEAPITALIEQVSDLDEDKALAIARTLSHTTVFNEVVREQITQMKVGERYEKITDAFNSIRDDAKSMVDQLDDGKISTMERLQNLWMRVTRGDIPNRFRKIKDTYLDVTTDTKDQIERETKILESYKDFRVSLKEAQVMAFQLLKKAEAELDAGKGRLETGIQGRRRPTPAETANRSRDWNWSGTSACGTFRMKTSAIKSSRTWPKICRSATTPPRWSWHGWRRRARSRSGFTRRRCLSSAPTRPCSRL